MKRDLAQLSRKEYDLLVIGGGISGVCTAWDAALRGLSVALVEKADFGQATLATTLRVVHGQVPYSGHLNLRRMRRRLRERTVLMRIAPHLVHPFPFLIPTYGHGGQGIEVLAIAMLASDLISFDRNQLNDPEKFIPHGRLISRYRCRRILPGLEQNRLTGGAILYGAQIHNSERLTLSFARSAAEAGADMANYAEVVGFSLDGRRVRRANVKDVLTGEEFEVQAKVFANITGPWSNIVLGLMKYRPPERTVIRSKSIQIVAPLLCEKYAFGIRSQHRHSRALARGERLLFVTPWRGRSLIGASYALYRGDPDDFSITERDIAEFVAEVNAAYPGACLKREDISFWHGGLRPTTHRTILRELPTASPKYEIRDHARRDHIQGLISVVGAKYSTCRLLAEKVVDLVFRKLGYLHPPRTLTRRKPVFGGRMERFEDYARRALREMPESISENAVRRLIYNYGSEYRRILRYIEEDPGWGETIPGSEDVLKAEVVHGVREEMACRLTDVVMRRTDLGCLGHPGEAALRACADIVAAELGWDEARRNKELAEARMVFVPGGPK